MNPRPVGQDTECRPVNPYGTTKLVGERMIEEVAAATGLRYANLATSTLPGRPIPP
jgi:UDP-glucose 4-epimerase